MIAFGYPLYHSKQNRAAPLVELPAGTRMLFVMGEKDDTALGPTKSKKVLTDVLGRMPAAKTCDVQ